MNQTELMPEVVALLVRLEAVAPESIRDAVLVKACGQDTLTVACAGGLVSGSTSDGEHRTFLVPRGVAALAEHRMRASESRSDWSPPPEHVGAKAIVHSERFRKAGKNPSRSTLQRWAETDKVKPVYDPISGEAHYPETWVHDRFGRWTPRRSA